MWAVVGTPSHTAGSSGMRKRNAMSNHGLSLLHISYTSHFPSPAPLRSETPTNALQIVSIFILFGKQEFMPNLMQERCCEVARTRHFSLLR